MRAVPPLKRDLTSGAHRTREYRKRLTGCARLVRVEVDIGLVNSLVAAGLLRDGDASQRTLSRACRRALELWADARTKNL